MYYMYIYVLIMFMKDPPEFEALTEASVSRQNEASPNAVHARPFKGFVNE